MAPSSAHLRHSLTDSWAAIDPGAESIELTSEEERVPNKKHHPQEAKLSSSRIGQLGDALGNSRSHLSQETTPRQSPRKRTVPSNVEPARPFVMPKLEHTSSQDSSPVKDPAGRKPSTNAALRSPRPRKRLPRSQTAPDGSLVASAWDNAIWPFIRYLLSIISIAANFAKPLIAYALALYLIIGGLIMARNLLLSSVHPALSPLCTIPGTSFLLPFCAAHIPSTPQHGDPEFAQLITHQSAFEDVLTTSAESATLPMDMKRSEASIRDLRHVVEYSGLPSRAELVFEFSGFIDTARQASADLSRYNSRIGRAVDRVLSTNRWTLQVLDSIAATQAERGAVAKVLDSVNIFAPFTGGAVGPREQLYQQYIAHTAAIEEQISDLIVEATALLSVLNNLDDRLDVIAGITARDGVRLGDDRDELFASLWTKLGGNRADVNRLQRQMSMLGEVGRYRKLAFAHVSGTVVKLQAIAAGLEDLRERVAAPEVLGVEGRPLEMHVEEIMMGLERLEGVREEGRRVEGMRLRGVLDKDERLGLEGGKGSKSTL